MQAIILRLNIEPAIGHVYLIPRNNGKTGELEATFNLGYKGMISLAYRNPDVAKVVAESVRENDIFEFVEGSNASLIHKRPKFGTPRGNLVGAYAYVQFKSGATVYKVMDREEIMKHKNFSQARNASFSPWNARVNKESAEGDWENTMWEKTPFRALANHTPLSTDTTLGVASDEKTILPEMFKGNKLDLAELEDFEPMPQLDPAKEVKPGASPVEGSSVSADTPGPSVPGSTKEAKTGPDNTPNPIVMSEQPPKVQSDEAPAGPALPELKPPIDPPDGSMDLGDVHEERDPSEILLDKMEEAQTVLKLTRDQFKVKMLKYGVDIDKPINGTRINAIIKVIQSMLDFHDPSK